MGREPAEERGDTAAPSPEDRCVHELFEAQAEETPDAVAVVFEEERLTYREIDVRANRLAHHLRRLGVGPEVLVGLFVERSLDTVLGVLGILKAGGAYVPLDPTYPRDRLAFMLEDSGAAVLLTQQRLIAGAPEHRARLLALDTEREWESIDRGQVGSPASGVRPDNLAYVIYTSGSTGRPKGVAMPHRPLVNLIAWQTAASPGAKRTLQFAPLSFDVCFQEMFVTWASGGALFLVDDERRRDPEALLACLDERRIERLFVPPVALQQLAEAACASGRSPRDLREIIAAGEALQVTPAVRGLFGALPGAVLRNQYGPTETHVVSEQALEGDPSAWPRLPSIGCPIANARLHLLDEGHAPVPAGEPGELYIGGAVVARGYLHRPELTAERFLQERSCDEPGARMYKTGDLCRLRPDGTLEFLGRVDHQVKIRGFRVELGEIESVLAQHPAIREAAVLAREDGRGNKQLVAYLVPRGGPLPAASELRRHLRDKLLEYMVPAAFVDLPALPLTPSGKVDRRSLPAPDLARPERGDAVVAARTPIEEVLAGIWAELLRVDRVSVFDDFFELGGHSLLAAQALGRLRRLFHVDLSLRALFEHPTVAALAAHIEAARRSGARPAPPPIVARGRGGPAPVSFAQQGLWMVHQIEPDVAHYNIARATRLEGPLDVSALERSLGEIVRRHEALRTTFSVVDGEVRQVISAERPFEICLVDLGALPLAAREADALRLAGEEAARPFDLSEGPLFRATLIRIEERSHLLLSTTHHIVSDGWSESVLWRELSALYEAFSRGLPSPLGELPVQIPDHALWQREWLSEELLSEEVAYWRERLRGAPPALELPLDHGRPAAQSHRGAKRSFTVPAELTAALSALARRENVTLFMVLLAAFQVLMQRYSGQDDIVVGSPVAGRADPETDGLIGLFVNTLVLRTSLAGEPTFSELCARVREVTLGAYAHQRVPFARLVQELSPSRDLGRAPLAQVLLVMENAPPLPRSLGEASLSHLDVQSGTSKLDLLLSVEERTEGLACTLEYATDLFEEATIAGMASRFTTLLEGVASDPGRRLHELPLSTAEERHRVVVGWNQTKTDLPAVCIQDLFEAEVEKAPDAVAVVFGEQRLTYRELNARANQLAHHLRALGVGPEVPVALFVERSVEMVVGLLGVLKAGGAYVPLDPSHPVERLDFLLEDTGARVLLTQQRLIERSPGRRLRRIALDAERQSIAGERPDNPASGAGPDSLAYVMYTSGSTGQPKGVCVLHRGVVRLVKQTGYASFGSAEVFLQAAPIAFDASTLEIWGALLNGGRLVVPPPEKLSLEALGELVERNGVTTLWLTAGLFNVAIDERPSALAPLRQLLVGGEALSVPHVREALRRLPGVTLVNGYGPTEGTTFSCCFTIAEVGDSPSIPIGRPITNTVAFVLDRHLAPVPVGVPGELYVGGAGVARGYLNRPDLTAERFVRDPFSDDPGARLYRTGDLCRWRADGNLEYLGRLDHQVKIRGFRIEPGEIECALAQHPAVREAVVLAREDAPGDKRLVAYVAPAGGAPPEVSELRAHLQGKLPEHMVPAAFLVLDAMPLTPNGKVDRRALPAPDAESPGLTGDFVPPRTPVEEVIAGLWGNVLGLRRIGVLDDFFALGGHSLMGTLLIARLGAAFGVELPLRALFEAPTVALLAERVEAALRSGGQRAAPSIGKSPRGDAPPLSFAQQRLWFLDQLEPGLASYNIPRAVRLDGPLDVSALDRSLAEIVRRHEALRTTFVVTSGEPRQVIAAPEWTLPVIDLGALPEAAREPEARRLSKAEAERPFDLERGPLFRASLVRLSERAHVLLTTAHHSVSDGWSESVFARELSALYGAFSAGRPSPLPELPIQYADYAVWQRAWLSGDVLEAQLAYWKEQLRGAPPAIDLPLGRPRPAVQSRRGAVQSMLLSAEPSAALRALARRRGVTLFMTLLAGFQVLLRRYSGQDDIVVGSPIAGRTRKETEGLIGFFLNTLVLRTDLGGDPTFSDLLLRVRGVTLGAYAHQDVPFEKLASELAPARDPSRTPLFQVFFNMLNLPPDWQGLEGISSESWTSIDAAARFDLNLYVEERGARLAFHLIHATELFDAAQTAAMLDHLREILEAAAADPDQPISRLPLSLPAACAAPAETVLGRPGPRFERFPDEATEQSLAQRFEAQARRHAGEVAVLAGGAATSYAELDAAAERVAAAIGEGAGRVALLFKPGLEMIAAMLGALKAGAAYVPLDLGSPAARLADILEDSEAAMLLTHSPCVDQARSVAPPGFPIIDAGALPAGPGAVRPASRRAVSPDDVAYILYTSGTTGRPKGVVQSHRNVLCHIRNYVNRLRLDPDDTVGLVASYAFDAAVMDIYGALLSGATLCPIDLQGDGLTQLPALLRRGGVTVYHSTPTVFRHLTSMLAPGEVLERVRLVVLGGELARAGDADAYRRHFAPHCLFVNGLGPTESTLALQFFLDHGAAIDRATVPVGYPVEGVEVTLETAAGEQAAIWGVGQIVLRSGHLALGYWRRPEATRAAFLPDPDGGERRRYHTGDLGRRLPGGAIEYVGRLDHQVKIRGQRIELGEVEAQLLLCPGVARAVVVVQDEHGDRSLAGYVVPEEGRALTVTNVREHLQKKLPPAMVPAAFGVLDELPLLPNGKVDRRALPPAERTASGGGHVAPRDALEARLVRIWEELLPRRPIGVDQDFFESGGHSLLAARLIVRIEQELGQRLRLLAVFEAPTIAGLAAALRQAEADPRGPAEVVRVGRPPSPRFFGDPAAPLWGVIDEPPAGAPRGHGVVVCAPIGHEHVRCHRALRQIGARLAQKGFHVLRFDFFGVGDSAGDLGDATVERWIADVRAAAEEVRAAAGVTRLSLLGVRLGAAVAMLAAREIRPHTLVAWDPVVSGEAYLRELERLHEAAIVDERRFWSRGSRGARPRGSRSPAERAAGGRFDVASEMELLGHRFSAPLVRSIHAVTPERVLDLPETRLFWVRAEVDPVEEPKVEALRLRGIQAELRWTDARTAWNDPRRVDELFLPGDATLVIPSCFEGAP